MVVGCLLFIVGLVGGSYLSSVHPNDRMFEFDLLLSASINCKLILDDGIIIRFDRNASSRGGYHSRMLVIGLFYVVHQIIR